MSITLIIIYTLIIHISIISCALWLPELFFKDEKKYQGINRLENIDKKRFNLICSICQTKSIFNY